MKRRKGFAVFVSVLMLLSMLTACTKSGTTETSQSTDPGTSNAETKNEGKTEEPAESKLSGKINISLPGASVSVWNAVADAYMKKNPDVKVKVDQKPAEGYTEWLTAQFAAGVPDVDLVANNSVGNLMADGKFMDYLPYLDKTNPYTGKPWKDSLDTKAMGLNIEALGAEDHLWNLNFESVQIVWVYNKEIFQKVGITEAPKTFNEMMDDFKKLKEAGYTPLALGGDSQSMWSGQAGWLVRVYADQYLRDYVNISRSQEQDYTYLPEVDEKWKLDLTDPFNDANSNVTKNTMRQWKAIKDKEGPYKIAGNPKWKAYSENLKQLFQYVPEGFFGVKEEQAYKLFLTGKAATMMGTPASYWQLPKDFADSSKSGTQGGVKPFEYGFYNMPSMEGPEVMAPARTIQIPIGFYGFVSKDAEQNALNADFMMYLTSPEGYMVYAEATQNSKDAALSGAPALKDITLPEEMTKAFADFKPIGNMEGIDMPATIMARGLWDHQPSVQEWVGSVQKFFAGKITTDEYLNQLQANIDKYFEAALKEKKFDLSDLEHPDRRPPERK
ncbi:ABC transporter substrate-binding protein [Paenibacillus sp. SAF-054]|uniref:ABC transporter substrate-binding protein n=1 Tax=unclassified Paenibacillus TaxID=185978 RepID=UPI003F7F2111